VKPANPGSPGRMLLNRTVYTIACPAQHLVVLFGDESFQAVYCTGVTYTVTDRQTRSNQKCTENVSDGQKLTKKLITNSLINLF